MAITKVVGAGLEPDGVTLEEADGKIRIKDGGVTTDKIADGSITYRKVRAIDENTPYEDSGWGAPPNNNYIFNLNTNWGAYCKVPANTDATRTWDLGSLKLIKKVALVVDCYVNDTKAYLEVSEDGSSWTVLGSTSSESKVTLSGEYIMARYIRIRCHNPISAAREWTIWELLVELVD